jgi:competence protein ComEC
MYFLLRHIPFVRIAISFVSGIIAGIYYPFALNEIYASGFFLFLISLVFISFFVKSYEFRWQHGIIILSAFFVAGFIYSGVNKLVFKKNYFEKHTDSNSLLIVRIEESPKEKIRSLKANAEVKSVVNGSEIKTALGRLQLYFPKGENLNIHYGDILIIRNDNLHSIGKPKNPYEFDYRQFLAFKQIHHQAYISKGNFRILNREPDKSLRGYVVKLNRYFNNILKQNITNSQSFAIASSLLIGNREYLDFELIKAYSSSGAMHVLAVSGLHVGILFLILDKLMFFLNNRNRKLLLLKSFIIIFIIWLYAMLTGFSPSVQRAAIMFSLITLGKSLKRGYDIYNVLSVSAVFQLLLNPFSIMEVGFQLSYSAVLGIVMFQKFFTDLIYVRNKILNYLWQITCVSISAQLITFPIGLLYFHQFPLYFFVSNLVVIPAAFCIMLAGVAMLLLSPFPYISLVLGKLLSAGIFIMNQSVFLVEKLPYSLIQGLSISIFEAWLLYALIFLFFISIHLFSRYVIYAALIIAVMFVICINIENYFQWNQKQFVVYNTPKNTYAYDFISGKQNLLLASKSLTDNYSQMQFHIMHNWWEQDINKHFIHELFFVRREENRDNK